jgi:hypothetical protein
MAGYIENGSLSIQPISDTQASILDMLLFPGFTRMSTAIQGYLTIDLSVYVPLLCFFGLFVFACGRICKYLLGWLETYCSKSPLYSNKERPHVLTISSSCPEVHLLSYASFRGDPNRALFANSPSCVSGKPAISTGCDY